MDIPCINNILKRIAQEDRKAFDELFAHYYPRLLKFARRYVKTYENAEEVVMDVFVKLLKKRKSLADIRNFNSYIFYAVKNQAVAFLNKKKPESIVGDDEEDYLIIEYDNPETKLLDQEMLDLLRETIENLPSKRKIVYKLVKEDGLQYKEVAKLLNISHKTVEVHMGLAINSIRTSIDSYLKGNERGFLIRKILPATLSLAILKFLLVLI